MRDKVPEPIQFELDFEGPPRAEYCEYPPQADHVDACSQNCLKEKGIVFSFTEKRERKERVKDDLLYEGILERIKHLRT
jgi:hypothetical protein